MRIGFAQINPTLGDFANNAEKIVQFSQSLAERKCELIVFPECALPGYHPFDLLERPEFIASELRELQRLLKKLPAKVGIIFGLITENETKLGKPYHNSAVFVEGGKIKKVFRKELLPTGDVFDEARFIEKGSVAPNYFIHRGRRFLLTICEDIWAWPDSKGRSSYSANPLKKLTKQKTDLIINLSASPYFPGKRKLREKMVATTAQHFKAPMVYANLVGAQDEMIFDGQSFAVDKKGRLFLSCAGFTEDTNIFDLNTLEIWAKRKTSDSLSDLHAALILGLRDFSEKTGLKQVVVGLSGGIDSALVLALACDAFGPQNCLAVQMPGPFTADMSIEVSRRMCKTLGVSYRELSISDHFSRISKELNSVCATQSDHVAFENLQARLRGLHLMAISNLENRLLLATSNKDELACGYATLYGDMCGGLAPIGDLTKGQIFDLANWYNCEVEIIPQEIIARPPSAELRANQTDQDSLPPYNELDEAVVRIVEQCKPAKSKTDQFLVQALARSEFKRWQAPPILKVSPHAFGRGRRYPIAHRFLSP